MNCPNCNSKIKKNTKFCPKCGTEIPQDLLNQNTADENDKPSKKSTKFKVLVIIGATVLALAIFFVIAALNNFFCMFGHKTTVNTVAPTCFQDGYTVYDCNYCSWHLFYKVESFGGHRVEEGECGDNAVCARCGEEFTIYHEEYGNKCSQCGMFVYNIISPELPIIVNCYNYDDSIEQTIKITEIVWEPQNNCIKWAAERIYHEDGNNHSASAKFGWKIYDSEGYVIDSGTAYSDGTIKVGEKVKNQEIKFFPSLYDWERWENYTLEILNVK